MTPADKARLEALITEQLKAHCERGPHRADAKRVARNVAMAAYELGREAAERDARRAFPDALGQGGE